MDIEKIKKQFESSDLAGLDWATIAQLASLVSLEKVDRSLYEAIVAEFCAQESTLKMIASENYSSLPVQLAMGNWMTDKYAEGSVGHRFYSGCHNVDLIEEEASSLAKKLFQSEAAYVQPHSGSDANLIAYAVLLQKAVEGPFCTSRGKSLMELSAVEFESMRKQWMDCAVLGMDLSSGGHLTHGFRANLSGKLFRSFTYGVDPTTGWIDYDEVEKKALEVRPAILIAGYSSYPRRINFRRMKEIANRVGAFLLADMAHFAGFVAAGLFQGDENPILHADLVTSTTHKTLRGPRGGIILGKKEFESVLLRGCPLVQGGPLPHVMAAKGIAFREALQPSFVMYAKQMLLNSQALSQALFAEGVSLLTGGSDNHLLVIDLSQGFSLSGKEAAENLYEAGICVNKNAIPKDPKGVWETSGIRIGVAALTTRGLKEKEMELIAGWIAEILRGRKPREIKPFVTKMAREFPVYLELREFLQA